MRDYQRAFFELAMARGVLRFGTFTLKSGRQSPYFFNAGLFNTGRALGELARCYVRAIHDSDIAFDMVFGPAYKGIPLVAAVSVALSDTGGDVPWAFNRKEAKDHGEGGDVIGAALAGRVLIIDDVISAGTSIGESVGVIRAHGAEPAGVAIALDRQERGSDERSAVAQVQADYGMPVVSIAGLDDLIDYLGERGDLGDTLAEMRAYRERYGT